MADTPRLLHPHSQYGYAENLTHALHAEPEAAPRAVQEQITINAHRTRADEVRVEWLKARSRISSAVVHFEQVAAPKTHVRSNLRVLGRVLERLDREIGL